MKTKNSPLVFSAHPILLACCIAATGVANGITSGDFIKANNTLDLDLPASWVGGVVPSGLDVAVWDATVTGANSSVFTSDQFWDSIRIANPGGLVTVSGNSLNLSGASTGVGIDLSAATQNLLLDTTVILNTNQEWNIGTGRSVSIFSILGAGVNLTKTGSGTVRIGETAEFDSLSISEGRVETLLNGSITAPGGIFLGGPGGTNPTLALGRSQQVPPLFVTPGTTGATLDVSFATPDAVNLGAVFLDSPLTIRRSGSSFPPGTIRANAPILGGTAPGTDALVFSALSVPNLTNWLMQSAAPNDFTGNVRFTFGRWNLAGAGTPENKLIPDASLVTVNSPAQVNWNTSQLNETIDGLAGNGIMRLNGTGNTLVIKTDNGANEGARVFTGSLAQSGSATWVFDGLGTQVLAGNRITYSGPTVINSGSLVLRDATAFASSSVSLNGGTLELQATSGAWSFGRPITDGAGELVKSGDGTVTLTASNAHSGRTLVHGGTLALGAGGALPNTSAVVIAGGTFNVSALPSAYQVNALLGNGSITGSILVSSRLAPGHSTGMMNFEDLTLAALSIAEFEVTGGGTAADLANVSGQLNLNQSVLSLLQLGTFTPNQKYTLFAYQLGNLIGTFRDLPDDTRFVAAGGSWRIDYDDPTAGLNGGTGNRFITLTAVPEPASHGMLGLVLVSAWLRRRRD